MTGHDHDRQVEIYGECVTCATREPEAARRARDEAIERVSRGTPVAWVTAARNAVERLAADEVEFTTDDVWALVPQLDEPRAMGPIMLWASERGLVEATARTRPSKRTEAHAGPKRIWRSLVTVPPSLFD